MNLNDSLLKGSCSRVPLAVFHGQRVLQVRGNSLPTLDTVTMWKTFLNVYSILISNTTACSCFAFTQTLKVVVPHSSTSANDTNAISLAILEVPLAAWQSYLQRWLVKSLVAGHPICISTKKPLRFWLRQVPRFVSKANFGSDATFCKYSSTYIQLPVFTIRNQDFRTAAKISRYETTFWGDFGFSTKYQSCYASVSRCPFHIGIRVLTFSPGFSFNLSSQFVSQATKQDVDRVSGYLATYPSLSITIIRKVLLVKYQRSWRKAWFYEIVAFIRVLEHYMRCIFFTTRDIKT